MSSASRRETFNILAISGDSTRFRLDSTDPNRICCWLGIHGVDRGGKEIFWFGLELCQVPYYFAKHYGIGLSPLGEGNTICGNALAHLNAADRLLWFNGGLLENKHHDKETFGKFSHYILGRHWLPEDGPLGVSCEDWGEVRTVRKHETKVLSKLFREARLVYEQFQDLVISQRPVAK